MKISIFYLVISVHLCYGQDNISIVSWNISDFGQSRDDSEIELIANVVKDCDVIAIQEVVALHPGGAKAVGRLVDQLNRLGNSWDYTISAPTKSSSSYISERYAFIWKKSKLTVIEGGAFLISEISKQVQREPYLISFKEKKVENQITLINFHACTHKDNFPERMELKVISNWIQSKDYKNVVFLGDMNLNIRDSIFDHFYYQGFINAFDGQKTTLKNKCVDGNYLSRAEDNILYKLDSYNFKSARTKDFIDKWNCEEVIWKKESLSDHLPLILEIQHN